MTGSTPFIHLSSFLGILFTLLCISRSIDCSSNVTVDNLDDRILYHDEWTVLKNENAIDGSVSVTYTAGLYFTLEFQGTAIYIVGSAFQDAAPFSPAIDGIVLADFMTGDRTTSTIKPIWGMYGLTAGVNHILNVTIGLNPNVTTKSNFELDAILYTTEDDNITTNVSSSTTGPSTSISTSLLAPTADSSHLHSSISAKTLGGVVGGCIFVLIFIISASLCLQRMRRIKSREMSNATPLPFVPGPETHIDSKIEIRVSPSTTPNGTEISDRILQGMSEIRMEIARLRNNVDPNNHNLPPEYDTISMTRV